MFKSIALVSTLVVAAFAQTASVVTVTTASVTSTASQSMAPAATQSFNPALVNNTVARQWCRAQQNSCPDICGGRVSTNYCEDTTFTYRCVCANGTVPDCTSFQQTLPFYICEETYIQCMNIHPSTDPDGQQQCINNRQCGTRNATAERAVAASSSTSAATSSRSGSATGSASASGASATSSQGAAVAVTPVGTGAFAALLLLLCKLVL